LFRHFLDDGVDPFEIRRRVGRVSVDLKVLDLTDPATRAHLGVTEEDLTAEELDLTQEVAGAADVVPERRSRSTPLTMLVVGL
jgi:hypothetical protein